MSTDFANILEAEFNKRIAKITPMLQDTANFSTGYIKGRAPVRTGNLRNHSQAEMQGEYAFLLSSNVDYAAIVNSRNPYFDDTVKATEEKLAENSKKI